jgi:hypothetical protein
LLQFRGALPYLQHSCIMNRFLITSYFTIVLLGLTGFTANTDGWSLFASIKFKPKFIKEYNEKFLVPEFDSNIRAKEGELMTLTGHYIPFDLKGNTIILSKFPYSSCFFCGGAGPESVAEIVLETKQQKLKADQLLTVMGKLKLNNSDVNHMNFILTEAVIIKPEK